MLPEESRSLEWILAEMDKMDKEFEHASDWKGGKVSGAVYRESTIRRTLLEELKFSLDGGEELEKIIVAAYSKYCVSNPLHPDVFPAVRKMEAEIVAMTLRMYNHPDGAGTMTSGGTESIIMAVKTYRDWGRAVKGIKEPEMYEFYCLPNYKPVTFGPTIGSSLPLPMLPLTRAHPISASRFIQFP